MLRRIGYLLAFGAATAGLAVAGWPGAPASPATLVNRVEVIAAPVLLAAAGWAARRVFAPPGRSWQARSVRAGGYAAVFALLLVKIQAERFGGGGGGFRGPVPPPPPPGGRRLGENPQPAVLSGYLPEPPDLPDALPDREKVPVGAANLGR